jgi:hypothetical protein
MSAAELLAELNQRDIRLTVSGDRLRGDAPKGALTTGLRARLKSSRLELMALLSADEFEVAWRAEAMRPQAPRTGAIPFLTARRDRATGTGRCLSCGGPLAANQAHVRCIPCSRAAWLVLTEIADRSRPAATGAEPRHGNRETPAYTHDQAISGA